MFGFYAKIRRICIAVKRIKLVQHVTILVYLPRKICLNKYNTTNDKQWFAKSFFFYDFPQHFSYRNYKYAYFFIYIFNLTHSNYCLPKHEWDKRHVYMHSVLDII